MVISKSLEEIINITQEDEVAAFGKHFDVEYYIVESEVDVCKEFNEKKTYGIELVKKTSHGEEKILIKNFSFSRENTLKVLNALAANTVTPVTLLYIIDDMFGLK